ncbi:MAG TPA: pentapeptide repeat-containing protein [Thermoanaerobaculia bacterium]|nr:pentapeptide repeat-containing protein [Thermoanaerobaculia bacterium]
MSPVRVSFEYLAQINWSVLRSGIPLFRRFEIDDADRTRLPLRIRLADFLDEIAIELSGEDLAGKIHSYLHPAWAWESAWQITQKTTIDLEISLGAARLLCPVDLLPPDSWLRVTREGGRRLATYCLDEESVDPDRPGSLRPHFEKRDILWNQEPPLEAAIAALVSPNDRFSRVDGPLGQAVIRKLQTRSDSATAGRRTPETAEAHELMECFYEAILDFCLAPADFRQEFNWGTQAVRLLQEDRDRGARCLDLVCLACETLESMGKRPVFLLTSHGAHAALGVLGPSAGFPGGQPVCADEGEIKKRMARKEFRLLDVTCALERAPLAEALRLSTWDQLGRGFVHAVDIVRCRSWTVGLQRYSILPLGRSGAPWWIHEYLRRLVERIEHPVPAWLYLSREEYAQFLRKHPVERALSPHVSHDSVGGVSVDLERLAAVEGLDPAVLDELRQRAEAVLQLHDPSSFFVPLRARLRDTGETQPVLAAHAGESHLLARITEPGSRIALFAPGGSGKTYVCEGLAVRLARACLESEGEDAPVPILLRLRDLGREDRDILRALGREVTCQERDLQVAARKRKLIFLLDSLEESDFSRGFTDPRDYVELLRSIVRLPNSSILLTARPSLLAATDAAAFFPGFTAADLEGWSAEDFGLFLSLCQNEKKIAFGEGGWQAFHGVVVRNPGLRELAKTPLFARMMVETRDHIGGVGDAVDLYERYTEHCFERRRRHVEVELARAATREVAALMFVHQDDSLPGSLITNALSDFQRAQGIEFWRTFVAREVIVHGLLVPDLRGGRRDEEVTFRFSHASFQHFMLATRLVEELARAEARLPGVLGFAILPEPVADFMAQILRRPAPGGGTPSSVRLEQRLRVRRAGRRQLFARHPSRRGPENLSDIGFRNLALVCLRAGCSLEKYDLSYLNGAAHLQGIDLEGVCLAGADLTESDLHASVLRRADLSRCVLERADLAASDLSQASLLDADLTRCKMIGADLAGCRMGRIRGEPRLCRAVHLDRILLEDGGADTLDLLERAVAACPEGDWQREARAALGELREKLPAART